MTAQNESENDESVSSDPTPSSEPTDPKPNDPKGSDMPPNSELLRPKSLDSTDLIAEIQKESPTSKKSAKKIAENLFRLKNLPVLQEQTRSYLAKFLVGGFVLTMVGIFAVIFVDKFFYYSASDTTKEKIKDQTGTKDLLSLVLTAQSSLVGAAIGFYFGTRDNK